MFYKTRRFLFLAATVVALAGCAPNGSSSSADFDRLAMQLDDIEETLAPFDTVQPGNLPNTGSARYDGAIGMIFGTEVEDELALVGELQVNVAFSENAVAGSATNFQDRDEREYQGSLNLINGTIFRTADIETEFTFNASLAGQLSSPEGMTYSSNTVLADEFYGNERQFISGNVQGSFSGQGGEIDILRGDFIASNSEDVGTGTATALGSTGR